MPLRVGIIGAGIAGLTLATRLTEAGHAVVLLDKGRGVGGRTSTRRAGAVSFDHGAQYFTIRDHRFRAFLDDHLPGSAWARWDGRFGALEAGQLVAETRLDPRYVGVPGMSAIARELAAKLDVRTDVRVVDLAGKPGAWTLIDAAGVGVGPLDWVVSTAPPSQTAMLLEGRSPIAEAVGKVVMSPCFALMIEPLGDLAFPFDGLRADHPVLGWLANNHSKPGRGPKPALVIQSNHSWAEAHQEDPLPEVARALKQAVLEIFPGNLDATESESVHRWLYAKPVEPLGEALAIDRESRLAAAGDWCVAGKVEGAFASGFALADALIESSIG